MYTPALLQNFNLDNNALTRDDIVALYYHSGYTIKEVIGFLASRHDIALSERQVHRILRKMNLHRRDNQSSLEEVINAILHELSGTGQNVGYRGMRGRLLVNHGLVVSCEIVRLALSVLDAEGVAARRQRSLRRRTYMNKGPNFAIHIDGWDKLKPFGISVHAAIDGFSRRILWLRACDSNKKPHYIAQFYMDYIKEVNGVPMIIYADRGTENSITRDMQYALRWHHSDPFQGLSSFIYGSSTRNTRIERFWRNMREMCGNTYMNHFKDMADYGILDTSDNVHLECVRYCFMPLINQELKRVINQWNIHRIRPSRNLDGPCGKPDVLFFQPEVYGTRDFKMSMPGNIGLMEQEYAQYPPSRGVSVEFEVLATSIICQYGLRDQIPTSIYEASELFIQLTHYIGLL